jgi:hypothetical protein
MTYYAEMKRQYDTREAAYAYLASRGFLFLPGGWANGRWAATLDKVDSGFILRIWLRALVAA